MKKILLLFGYLFTISILFCSCQKEQPSKNDPKLEIKDSILILNESVRETDTILDIIKSKNGYNYFVFGERAQDGTVQKLSAMAIIKNDVSDTALNILYDDSLRVKGFYFVVNGIKDPTIVALSYNIDSISYCEYSINWETGDRILQYQHSISYNQLKSLYKSKENLADSSNSFKDAIALVGGLTANTYGFIITVIVSTAFGAAVAPIPIAGAIVGFIGSAAAYVLYPGNSNAGELTQIPNIPNNPTITFRGLETVSVSAKNIWPSSSVDVKIGEHINITATGAWCHASSGPEFGLFGPNGFSRIGGSDVVLPGTNVGALIGRINNGTPFIVGSTLDLITSESGILEFSMNDAAGQYSDNVGSLIVSLRR